MAYRSAIGLGVSGLALLLLGLGMAGAARLTAAIVAGASLLQAVAELASVNIGIDRLLRDPYILPNSTIGSTLSCAGGRKALSGGMEILHYDLFVVSKVQLHAMGPANENVWTFAVSNTGGSAVLVRFRLVCAFAN